MLAICHYNLIVDEKEDLGEIIKAKEYFIFLVEEFPNTDFAEDSKFKLELSQFNPLNLNIEIIKNNQSNLSEYRKISLSGSKKWDNKIKNLSNILVL